MNNMSKVFFAIIIILVVALGVSINRWFYFKDAYVKASTEITKIAEKSNKIEESYGRNVDKVKIEVKTNTITSTGATIVVTDNNDTPYIWKENYKIEKKVNDKWEKLKTLSDTNFSETAYKLDENSQIEQEIDWSEIYGTLSSGIYRIEKYVYTTDSDIYFQSDEFEIK